MDAAWPYPKGLGVECPLGTEVAPFPVGQTPAVVPWCLPWEAILALALLGGPSQEGLLVLALVLVSADRLGGKPS